jgi:hypothetical protein
MPHSYRSPPAVSRSTAAIKICAAVYMVVSTAIIICTFVLELCF